jgi:hypothetical protein
VFYKFPSKHHDVLRVLLGVFLGFAEKEATFCVFYAIFIIFWSLDFPSYPRGALSKN